MNNEKLIKALKKELTRNPKKTIALGLVSVVALWFWAPLVTKWVGGDVKKAKPVASATSTATPAPSATTIEQTPTPKTPVPTGVTMVWDELLGRIARDERMQPAEYQSGGRDPFAITAAEEATVAATQADEGKTTTAPPLVHNDPSPADLGLILQGTIVSAKTRRATVSGRTYKVGDTIKIKPQANTTPGASTGGWEFVLSEIDRQQVLLTRKDKQFALKLVRETLADGDQVTLGSQMQQH